MRFVLFVVVFFPLQTDCQDPVAVASDFIDMLMDGKFTTNLTNLTNGTQCHGSPHDALVLEFAMRPEVYE